MAGDWLRLYRKSLDSRVFSDDWLWRLWCWCLMKANWKTHYKNGREILPGQFTMGRSDAADQLEVSPSKLYRGLAALVKLRQIKLESNNRFTVVTILKWEEYQSDITSGDEIVKNTSSGRNIQKPDIHNLFENNDLDAEKLDERTASEQPVNSQRTASEQPVNTLIRREEGKEGKTLFPPDKPARKSVPKSADPKPRPRDDLFDAIAEITGSDPKASGSHVGKVAAALRKAEPPYTPADVRALPGALQRGGMTVPVTLGVVEKYIGWVRNPPANGKSHGGHSGVLQWLEEETRNDAR